MDFKMRCRDGGFVWECLKGSVWILCCHGDKWLPVHVHTLNHRKVEWFSVLWPRIHTHIHTHTQSTLSVGALGLLLQGEAEVSSAALDLVLGLQVVHALCGDAVDGQNHVSNGDTTFSRLPAVCQLQGNHKQLKLPT